MRLEKAKNVIYKIILFVLLILVLYISYCSIFNIYCPNIEMKPIVIILGIIICICTFISLKKIISKIDEKKSNYIALGICSIFLIGLSILGSKMTIVPNYDFLSVQKEVQEMLKNGGNFVSTTYFEGYKNQIPITLFSYYVYKIAILLKIGNLKLFSTIISAIFIVITAFFTYLSVKKVKDYKLALITLIFFVANPIFYLYASSIYSDIICMPFATIGIYLFILAMKTEKSKKIISSIFSGIMIIIGFSFKPVIGILLVGMIIGVFIDNKFNRKSVVGILCLIAGAIIGILLIKLICMPFNLPNDKNKEVPITYWLKMGVNTDSDGGYTQNDFKEYAKQPTYMKKIKSDLKIIKNRLNEMGLKGWIALSKIKLSRTWSNGDYRYTDASAYIDESNRLYEYVSGNKRIFLIYYCQILKATMLVVLFVAVAKELGKREKERLYSVIYISIFGAILFSIVWEASGRYSLTFLPWLMLVFGIGITQLENLLTTNKIECILDKNKIQCFNMQNIQKIIMISTIICSSFLLVINYYTYAVEKEKYTDVKILQDVMSSEKTQVISNKKIEQTFKTSKKFNSIAIRFKQSNDKNITHYSFILYDSNKQVIYKEDFDSSDKLDGNYKTFKFPAVKPKGKETYIIQISSKDADDKNSIKMFISWQGIWTDYSGEQLTIDGKEIEGSATFKVQNKTKRTYTTERIYITMSLMILAIEIFAFYPFLRNEHK